MNGNRTLRRIAAMSACAATVLALAPGGASAVPPGLGTYTRITTPATDLTATIDPAVPIGDNTFTVAGQASPDVTAVNIACVYSAAGQVRDYIFASNILVSNGSFSTTAVFPTVTLPCRLRALPTSLVAIDGSLDSFSGPVLYSTRVMPESNFAGGSRGYADLWQGPLTQVRLSDAGQCGVFSLASTADQHYVPDYAGMCLAALPFGNVTATDNPTSSSIGVDGHAAYLPRAATNIAGTVPGLVPTSLTVTHSAAPNGDVLVTESAPLVRCSKDDTYPPTATSCPAFTQTGVSFSRQTLLLRNGQQARVRDAYVSADGAQHALALEYGGSVNAPTVGTPATSFPGHGGLAVHAPGQTLTGFGTGAATVYLTSNMYAWPGGTDTGYGGLTWSRPPSSVIFSKSGLAFGLRYAVSVPAGGIGSIGFTYSETVSIPATQALAAAAEAEVMSAPSISSPVNGARVGSQTTTVTGSVSAGANGLPTAVLVNGHPAVVTPTSASTATYSARFAQSWGAHVVTVVAVDAGGNTRTASVTVTNSPALGVRARPRLSRASLVVPLSCQRFAASSCVGKVVVKSARGAVIGSTRAFTVGRGRSASVGVRIRPGNHVVRVYLYQRDPTGAYVLVSAKPYRI